MVGPFNFDRPWSFADDLQLRLLAARNTPTIIIALRLGRTVAAVYARASRLGISLKP